MTKLLIDRELLRDIRHMCQRTTLIGEIDAILAQPEPAEEVEVAAWSTHREQDPTFPRLHATETEAQKWIDCGNVNPPISKEPLMTIAQHHEITARQGEQVAALRTQLAHKTEHHCDINRAADGTCFACGSFDAHLSERKP